MMVQEPIVQSGTMFLDGRRETPPTTSSSATKFVTKLAEEPNNVRVLPAQPRRGMTREIYLKRIRESLDSVTGHFHSIWYVDHLQFQDAPILEGWTALTYIAACYPYFQFGNVVLAQSFRNPALLAKMAATAQYMSEGRFIL